MANSLTATNSLWMLSGQVNPCEPVREVSINSTPFHIGRRPDLSFCLPSRTVSSLHASIELHGGRPFVRDLGSTNGTFLNGRRVESRGESAGPELAGRELAGRELREGDLLQFADLMFRVKRTVSTGGQTIVGETYDQALALIQFDKLMTERAVVPYFQPIVSLPDCRPRGYEILARSHLFGLKQPQAMFLVASQLNLAAELSRMLRWEALRHSERFASPPQLFLNTHPVELRDLQLLELHLEQLRRSQPDQEVTLEIHESAVTNPSMMRDVRAILGGLNVGLAYDDFGAGQARLIELVEVPPDYLKVDITLIKDIDKASAQRKRMVASLVQLVRDLGVAPLAEGIETPDEHQACIDLGFAYGQGFHYGRPAPVDQYRQGWKPPSGSTEPPAG